MSGPSETTLEQFALADWRRKTAALYATIRATRDAEAAWRTWRQSRDALFRNHPQSPLDPSERQRMIALDYFPHDPSARHIVSVNAIEDGAPVCFDLGKDGRITLVPFARTLGLAASYGGELTLYWVDGYGGGLFLPFKDATCGAETYDGGRYLLDGIKGADLGMDGDKLILDFNFAYNPSCAYADRWVCPLAPNENRLPRPVRAGEKRMRIN